MPQPLSHADGGDVQAAGLGEDAELAEQARDGVVGADGVARDKQDARLDAVAEEGAAVGAEEVVLVPAELEIGERVGPVAADELPRRVSRLAGRERARRR